jgi:hypothetical protein
MTDLDDTLGQQFDDVALATALWLNGAPRCAVPDPTVKRGPRGHPAPDRGVTCPGAGS